MSNKIRTTVDSHVDDALKELNKKIPIILEEWGLAGERFAKLAINRSVYDTPPSPTYKRTGRLRSSLTHATKRAASPVGKDAQAKDGMQIGQVPDGGRGVDSVIVGTNVEYAQHVEFGTNKKPPRPYLKPAIVEHIADYKQIMEKHLT